MMFFVATFRGLYLPLFLPTVLFLYSDSLFFPSSVIGFLPNLEADIFFIVSSVNGLLALPICAFLILSLDSSDNFLPMCAKPIFFLCSSVLGIMPMLLAIGFTLYPLSMAFNLIIHSCSIFVAIALFSALWARQYTKAFSPCLLKEFCSLAEWCLLFTSSYLCLDHLVKMSIEEPT